LGFGFWTVAAAPALRQSKHNLALGGSAKIQAGSESDMCHFCHTPHGGGGEKALWNHALSTAAYIPYTSSTLKAKVGQPTGDSKLCLSCHDGTVALGMTHSQPKTALSPSLRAPMAKSRAVLGTDLSDDHPVSFPYDSALAAGAQLRSPALLRDRVRLDVNGQVQCTSCHDPHSNENGKFLVVNNYASALCLTCHDPTFWNTSAHRNSGRTWNGTGRNPWPNSTQTTVAANGCENCHTPHNAGTHQRLLTFSKAEDNCLNCHNGAVAARNLANEFNKPSVHPVLTTSSLHDEAEDPLRSTVRHAACVDCHNPHAANGAPGLAPSASGALAGVKGVNSSGAVIQKVALQYELCYRCHADSVAKGPASTLRQWAEPNLRLQFSPANVSFHPVQATGRNSQVPSLIAPWTASSILYCTDCHNNNQGPGAGGTGPNGPHGSLYAPILERNLVRQDFQAEGPATYALCYKCHSEDSLMADRLHREHVRDQKTACTTCHTPHGVQNQTHLVNFNTFYVKPLTGRLTYTDRGPGQDVCTLSCHGSDHNNKSYGATPLPLNQVRTKR
jgi:predicted CXXCH cytochrome family protein